MKRIYLFCGVGCIVALFAVTAFSQGSKPCCESAQDAKATPCNAAAKKDASCASSCCCSVTVKATTSKQANVYDLLEKLEGLKAKQDALESEVRETRALLNEKFRTLQERVAKVGMTPHGSPYALAISPVTMHGHYEPVTSYRTTIEKNPETGETKRVVTPVTNYIYRQSVPTYVGVPAQPAAVTMPAPCGPPTPAVAPACDAACPATPCTDTIPVVTPEPRPRPAKASKTDRPAPIKPVTESPSEGKPKKPDPAPTRTPVQPKPSLPDSLDDSSS